MELNQYLEDQDQVNTGSFVIDDEQKANWALRKIRSIKEKKQTNSDIAEAEIEKIQAWESEVNHTLDNEITHFETMLTQYALKCRETDPKFKTLKLPYGKIGFRKQQPSWTYDTDTVLSTLKQSGLTQFIRVKEELDKANFKKAVKVHGNSVINPDTGEIIPGVTVEEREDQIKVEVD